MFMLEIYVFLLLPCMDFILRSEHVVNGPWTLALGPFHNGRPLAWCVIKEESAQPWILYCLNEYTAFDQIDSLT